MQNSVRVNFGSKIGAILAAAGSAVGLGNIWRFPYEAGNHGGAAFILIYLVCVFAMGMPIMIAEFTVGRHAKASTGKAFGILAPGTQWKWIGTLGVLAGLLILGYYSVVAGWTLEYILASLGGGFADKTPDDFVAIFQNFSQDPIRPLIWLLAFLFLTHFIVIKGVKDGIEKSSKVMMPVLFILIVFLGAMGQAFFSLGLGMGCLSTYASYFGKETQLGKTALSVGVIDTFVAILAGLIIFPAAFSVGIQPDAGPSLIFITLPNVFQQALGGIPFLAAIFSLLFYVLLALAALTSTISLHEVVTAYLNEQFGLRRSRAAGLVTGFCIITGVLSSLSLGVWEDKMFGLGFFDLLDFVTAKIMLPLSGFLVCLFVGWYLKRSVSFGELTNGGRLKAPYFPAYMFILKFLAPIAILLIFIHELGFL